MSKSSMQQMGMYPSETGKFMHVGSSMHSGYGHPGYGQQHPSYISRDDTYRCVWGLRCCLVIWNLERGVFPGDAKTRNKEKRFAARRVAAPEDWTLLWGACCGHGAE
eukprot:545699-Rhodomonas_salina.2